jgi:hypothetical protein
MIFLSLWSMILLAFAIAVIGTIRLLRAQEEQDIAIFISSLVAASEDLDHLTTARQ